MKTGLVGFSQTGKTTLFNALTGLGAQTGGGGGKANLGVIRVPDERVDRLSEIFEPRKTTYAEVIFVDVPGPRTKGRGFDSSIVSALQEADALTVVLRGFGGFEQEPPDPAQELLDFEAELILHDLGIVERRLERLKKEHGGDREKAALEACLETLSGERSLRMMDLDADAERALSSFSFLSRRPLLAVLNTEESAARKGIPAQLEQVAQAHQILTLDVCAKIEAEIAALEPGEQAEFLSELGVSEPASARIVRQAYALLNYISFFTVGPDEVRAWTVRRGSKAPKAAGRVHSDIERGFIRAEVMTYDEFIKVKSEAKMKELGRLRVEGKEYVVQDGDILHFRFNV